VPHSTQEKISQKLFGSVTYDTNIKIIANSRRILVAIAPPILIAPALGATFDTSMGVISYRSYLCATFGTLIEDIATPPRMQGWLYRSSATFGTIIEDIATGSDSTAGK
jgi:hypothetical protein